MTRLADALERANRTPDPAPQPPAPATAASLAHAPSPAPPHLRRMQPATIAVPRPAPAPTTAHLPGAPLLALPEEGGQYSEWHTDPQLAGKLFGTEGFSGAALEQYRKLAATLHHAQSDRGIRVIMTASALPGEGKSLTAVNLALTLSESYHRRVLLVDADLRRPTVQRMFALPPMGGLNEGLKLREDRPLAVAQISERLFVLPAGRPEPDPMSGLTSDRMRRLVAQAAATFDWVIIDTPPVGLLPDASLLADIVDGVLLVVRAGKAPFALVKRTVEAITHDRILGVVMNAVDYAHDRNAGGYYEYYGYGYYNGMAGQK
ncbi:MAG TPA: CpsD/CapB family tyrosine-protein kinase [Vicinamibacterales bacterium]|nr:CpsD/CapB family tyrosine-protein kinase [Vicinamibacterales bacterium]